MRNMSVRGGRASRRRLPPSRGGNALPLARREADATHLTIWAAACAACFDMVQTRVQVDVRGTRERGGARAGRRPGTRSISLAPRCDTLLDSWLYIRLELKKSQEPGSDALLDTRVRILRRPALVEVDRCTPPSRSARRTRPGRGCHFPLKPPAVHLQASPAREATGRSVRSWRGVACWPRAELSEQRRIPSLSPALASGPGLDMIGRSRTSSVVLL